MLKILLLGFGLTSVNSVAYSWGDVGHQTVAKIAESGLTKEARDFVESILGPEPLTAAAIWPDIVRDDKVEYVNDKGTRYKRYAGFAPYHFVEIPYGKTYEEKQKDDNFFALRDGHTILKYAPSEIRDEKRNAVERAILLRYLIHVVGDVHQPLHVGNGLDMGANLCKVKWQSLRDAKASLTDLHSLWDEGLIQYAKEKFLEAAPPGGTDKRYFGAEKFANLILEEYKDGSEFDGEKLSYKDIQSATFQTWFSEAHDLHPKVYPDRAKFKSPAQRPYCEVLDADKSGVPIRGPNGRTVVVKGSFDESTIPTLDEKYADEVLPVVKVQLLKGGLRLAKILNEMGSGFKTKDNFQDSLNSIMLKNKGSK